MPSANAKSLPPLKLSSAFGLGPFPFWGNVRYKSSRLRLHLEKPRAGSPRGFDLAFDFALLCGHAEPVLLRSKIRACRVPHNAFDFALRRDTLATGRAATRCRARVSRRAFDFALLCGQARPVLSRSEIRACQVPHNAVALALLPHDVECSWVIFTGRKNVGAWSTGLVDQAPMPLL